MFILCALEHIRRDAYELWYLRPWIWQRSRIGIRPKLFTVVQMVSWDAQGMVGYPRVRTASSPAITAYDELAKL